MAIPQKTDDILSDHFVLEGTVTFDDFMTEERELVPSTQYSPSEKTGIAEWIGMVMCAWDEDPYIHTYSHTIE